ncbi:DUF2184 domain-containing protein [Dyella mobilis]|nr:DUF2184 domain-containing protein [Dyella mobilis]GLQ96469.1 hypothetical protein GCM10007863_08870 [Dyella mobilis]
MSKLILPRSIRSAYTRDNGLMTFDAATIDSAGVFLVGELERLDQELHMPLASVTWGRDIDLREDVSIADEVSSYTNSTFAAAGGASPNGKSWIGKDATAIQGLALDIGKTPHPLNLWGMELGWTIPELLSAQRLGRPVDQQKFEGLQLKWNMDTDEQIYIGDTGLGVTGLVNNANVATSNAVNGNWSNGTTTPAQMLADVNAVLETAWTNSGYAYTPSELLLPPQAFSTLVQTIVSSAGNISALEYLKANCISNANNGKPLNVYPCKWLTTAGASGKTRMVAYTKQKRLVRFPLVPLQRTPLEYRGILQLTTYFGRLGAVEWVYPETGAYADGV